ncbi:Protein RALF-like 33 [Apostasia shenzhenica]|uniref:Protein RALF-like 33 n=1 Tax=Apostasia shenzhenica TaxID=1088818 RepID=A0A2I0B583_9ASPA|nr:Protein RALF-like 33 [Apostasia shenzhenica]
MFPLFLVGERDRAVSALMAASRVSALMEESRVSAMLIIAIALVQALLVPLAAAGSGEAVVGWIPGRSACHGTIAECLGGDEFDLATESSRRILAISQYISYNCLKHGSVPCSLRGASYYNCRPGAQANPYSRGCLRITMCRM